MLESEQAGNYIPAVDGSMVYDSVKRFALQGLSDLIRVLMENMDDALFDLSEKSDNDRERNMYFEAMREIRLKRNAVQIEFDREMKACFDQLSHSDIMEIPEQDPEELSLVELDDLEDNIAIDNMISKARPHFEDDLFAVIERLKVVLPQKTIKEDQNPLDPKAICDSFHKASDVIKSDIHVKLIFYKLFDKYVMNNLGHFYRELNDFFVDKGVLPEFKASQERMKQTTKFLANRIKNASKKSTADGLSHEQAGVGQGAPLNAGSQSIEGNLLSMLQRVLSSGASPLAITGSVTSGVTNTGQEGGGLANAGQSAGAIPAAQNLGYMTALTNLQTSGLQAQPLESIDPQTLKTETHQQLLAFSQENSQHATAAGNQIIDIVSMLFDFFYEDENLPAPIKVLIGRLQIPVLKIAILDDSFFNHKKHPARKLLDSISKASLGWGEDQKQEKLLIDKIEELVNYLLTEFEQNIEVFEKVLEDFNRFLADENEKIALANDKLRLEEEENERKRNTAQVAASKLTRKLTLKRELSFEVSQFLDSIWTMVLFNIYLTMGESSNHWKNIRRITSTFIWTLVPKFTEEERLKIIKTLPALLRALSKGMGLLEISTEAQNKIFQMLAKEHTKIVKQTSKNIVSRHDDITVWPNADTAEVFAGLSPDQVSEDIDIEFESGETGEIRLMVKEEDPDAITIITEYSTKEVIQNLENFTSGVQSGEIQVDEEIIMDSAAKASFYADINEETDEFLEQARALDIGSWVKFLEDGSKAINARLTWKSNVTNVFVFVNRQGQKVKNLSIYGLAIELRSGRAEMITSVSVFDRAIISIMSTLTH